MLAWGACGAAGALLAPLLMRRLPFALVCFVLGFAFSGLMDNVRLWSAARNARQICPLAFGCN